MKKAGTPSKTTQGQQKKAFDPNDYATPLLPKDEVI
jgi:hypothetical protein